MLHGLFSSATCITLHVSCLVLGLVGMTFHSVQFKMVSMRLGRPIYAPPHLLGVSPTLPLKQFQRWSDCPFIVAVNTLLMRCSSVNPLLMGPSCFSSSSEELVLYPRQTRRQSTALSPGEGRMEPGTPVVRMTVRVGTPRPLPSLLLLVTSLSASCYSLNQSS